MNILNLATTDQGGAGLVSLFLNDLFNKRGHESVLVVKTSKLKNPNVIVLNNIWSDYFSSFRVRTDNFFTKLDMKKQVFDAKYFFFNRKENKQGATVKKILNVLNFKPDVIILNWVSSFINAKGINDLAAQTHASVFWLMLDNAPITGGCHYPWDCKGFYSDCSDCPAILKRNIKRLAKINLEVKRKWLPESMSLITLSEADYSRAQKSTLFRDKRIHKILLPVDERAFKPGDKNRAKEFFGIESNIRVILYAASSIANIRKGLTYFIETISLLEKKLKAKGRRLDDYAILLAGKGSDDQLSDLKIPVIFSGYLNEDYLIKAYQCADVFVSTSLEDSGPYMLNQCLMTGTPVVSFRIGVALDLIEDGKTGYSAPICDCQAMANSIFNILDLDFYQYNSLCSNCRNKAIHNISLNKFSNSIFKLFE